MKTVELSVTDRQAGRERTSPSCRTGSGRYSFLYDIDPNECSTKLGGWLASKIDTTEYGADGSRLELLFPYSHADWKAAEMMNDLKCYEVGQPVEGPAGTQMRGSLEAYIYIIDKHMRFLNEVNEKHGRFVIWSDNLMVSAFNWPLYKIVRDSANDTPERYFDRAARWISKNHAIVLAAGRSCHSLPDDLLPVYGRRMLDRHEEEISGKGSASRTFSERRTRPVVLVDEDLRPPGVYARNPLRNFDKIRFK